MMNAECNARLGRTTVTERDPAADAELLLASEATASLAAQSVGKEQTLERKPRPAATIADDGEEASRRLQALARDLEQERRLVETLKRALQAERRRVEILEHDREQGLQRPAPGTPRVSVIIPVHNGSRTIAEALDSVFTQTFDAYEVIVVNDASRDECLEVLENYGPRIRLVSLMENRGQSAARNLGASLAQGEYLAFLDQDDVWYPRKLERQVAILDQHPEVGLVYSDLDEVDEQGHYKTLTVHRSYGMGHPKPSLVNIVIEDLFVLPSTVVCRKRSFEKAGGFDERLIGYEDDDLWIRMWPLCRFDYLPEALVKWRIHRNSSSESQLMERSRQIFYQKLMSHFANDPFMRGVVRKRFYNVYGSRGTQLLRRGEKTRARAHYWMALRNRPYAPLMLCRWLSTFFPYRIVRMTDAAWQRVKSFMPFDRGHKG
jgi:glycosyltransferase involved in cell wall biosynthesis